MSQYIVLFWGTEVYLEVISYWAELKAANYFSVALLYGGTLIKPTWKHAFCGAEVYTN